MKHNLDHSSKLYIFLLELHKAILHYSQKKDMKSSEYQIPLSYAALTVQKRMSARPLLTFECP